jgi:hypothetical protein
MLPGHIQQQLAIMHIRPTQGPIHLVTEHLLPVTSLSVWDYMPQPHQQVVILQLLVPMQGQLLIMPVHLAGVLLRMEKIQ